MLSDIVAVLSLLRPSWQVHTAKALTVILIEYYNVVFVR